MYIVKCDHCGQIKEIKHNRAGVEPSNPYNPEVRSHWYSRFNSELLRTEHACCEACRDQLGGATLPV